MRPLAEKSSGKQTAKTSGSSRGGGFERLTTVLKRESKGGDGACDHSESPAQSTGPEVETVMEEGVVKKIIVRCSCGAITEIDCRYDAPS
jgi:hypothetical protein